MRDVERELSSFEELLFVRLRQRQTELSQVSQEPRCSSEGQAVEGVRASAEALKTATERFLIKFRHSVFETINDFKSEFETLVSEHSSKPLAGRLSAASPRRTSYLDLKLHRVSDLLANDGFLASRLQQVRRGRSSSEQSAVYRTCPTTVSESVDASLVLGDLLHHKLEARDRRQRHASPELLARSLGPAGPELCFADPRKPHKSRAGFEAATGFGPTLDGYLKTATRLRPSAAFSALSRLSKTPTGRHLHKPMSERVSVQEDISVIKQKINEVISRRMTVRREQSGCSKYAVPKRDR